MLDRKVSNELFRHRFDCALHSFFIGFTGNTNVADSVHFSFSMLHFEKVTFINGEGIVISE